MSDIMNLAHSITVELNENGRTARCSNNFIPELFIWPDEFITRRAHLISPDEPFEFDQLGMKHAKVICNFYESHASCGPTAAGPEKTYSYCDPAFPENMYEQIRRILNGDY